MAVVGDTVSHGRPIDMRRERIGELGGRASGDEANSNAYAYEPAWRWAARFDVEREDGAPLEMLVVADGKRLAVAFRAPPGLEEALFELVHPGYEPHHFVLGFGGRVGTRGTGHGVYRRTADGITWEGVLDHFDLDGEAHPTRAFDLRARLRDRERGALRTQHLATFVLVP
jgi:hypothetical protein